MKANRSHRVSMQPCRASARKCGYTFLIRYVTGLTPFKDKLFGD